MYEVVGKGMPYTAYSHEAAEYQRDWYAQLEALTDVLGPYESMTVNDRSAWRFKDLGIVHYGFHTIWSALTPEGELWLMLNPPEGARKVTGLDRWG